MCDPCLPPSFQKEDILSFDHDLEIEHLFMLPTSTWRDSRLLSTSIHTSFSFGSSRLPATASLIERASIPWSASPLCHRTIIPWIPHLEFLMKHLLPLMIGEPFNKNSIRDSWGSKVSPSADVYIWQMYDEPCTRWPCHLSFQWDSQELYTWLP